jgi:CxxC motif-containing protein (DUF1111 family)
LIAPKRRLHFTGGKVGNKLLRTSTLISIVLMAFAVTMWPQEASQGLTSQNGSVPQKQFDDARAAFETVLTPADGLGIHFNEASCAACHGRANNQGLPGGSGPITEIRAGFLGSNNEFMAAPGGTLITTKAVGGATPEIMALSARQNVRDRFITPSLFGAGFVELIDDEVLRKIAKEQPGKSDGRIRGLIREVPILEAPGKTAVGKFGWAAQQASLLSFSAEAYRNEMGVTSPLQPNDNTLLGDPVDDGIADPEDKGGQFGGDVERFATFMRALSAPPRLIPTDEKERKEIEEGSKVFESTGCAHCHTPEFETLSEGSFVNGRALRVPKALGNKKFHPYADFLLHDIGTGPAILREGLTADARGKIRTAALWGLGTRQTRTEPLLHDGSARTIEEAITRHKNTSAQVTEKFQRLPERERTRLLKFLRSL